MTDPETQIAGYFSRYQPALAKLGKALRARLRARLPGLNEIVYMYENQEALVIAWSPSERGNEGLCSMALHPTEARLYFTRGAQLAKSDPKQLLQGRGPGVRHVVLHSIADFDRPEIEDFVVATLKLAKLRLDAGARGAVILKAEEQKKRARRAADAGRSAKRSPTKARR